MTLYLEFCVAQICGIRPVLGRIEDFSKKIRLFIKGVLTRLPKGSSIPLTLKVFEYELFHFCPLQEIVSNISFVAIRLLDMFNSGGGVASQSCFRDEIKAFK